MKQSYVLLGSLAMAIVLTFLSPFFQPSHVSADVSDACA